MASATFRGGSADSSERLALASTWLGNLTNGGHPDVVVIESDEHQDMIYARCRSRRRMRCSWPAWPPIDFVARRRRA